MKKQILIGAILICCILSSKSAFSQSMKQLLDAEYGLDPSLYSGFIYDGKYELNAKGSPFKYEGFQKGTLFQGEKEFNNLWLNIDIHQQLLILKFQSSSGADLYLELPLYKFTAFHILSDKYLILQDIQGRFSIFQSIGSRPFQFLIKHQKSLKERESYGQISYHYSTPSKQVFILNDSQEWIVLKKTKDLYGCGQIHDDSSVKKWVRKNKFRFRKSSDIQLNAFSIYLNQL